ncbi:hypothetical protein DDP54_15955 (plasmid) [Cellulomonas sp. WB94]|uniref:sulfocyanin-like copper-binding protein n=1 Tax=Cellulomonas sp. WB94 TaxID=2173174 RepID=UPI000D58491E|nr:sulfocyanin-like copper-binding protein [Cellulomonas sp. WB94]PVU81538.1 hypothetical protein DDP54_15955 [Cellulomonas sp. WB94]
MATTVRRGWLIAALTVAVAVLLGSVLAASAWAGAFGPGAAATTRTRLGAAGSGFLSGTSQAVPDLPGAVVNVSLTSMGGPMMGGPTMGGPMMGGPMMGGRNHMGGGVMRLSVDRITVPAGSVSFVATNFGNIEHELVILPLGDNQRAGTRPIGADSKIDEEASLGEASASGAAGAGDGIRPGSSGWVTLTLAPGRYELVCNLPGHYGAGMSTELTVS